MDLLSSPAGNSPASSISPVSSTSQQVLRKLSGLPRGQNPAFSRSQSAGLPCGDLTPVGCALDQACGLNTRLPPWEEAACRPLRAAGEHAGRARSRCRAGRVVSCPSCSGQNTLEITEPRPLSQGFCHPNYRAVTANVQQVMPQNQSGRTLQASHQRHQTVPRQL